MCIRDRYEILQESLAYSKVIRQSGNLDQINRQGIINELNRFATQSDQAQRQATSNYGSELLRISGQGGSQYGSTNNATDGSIAGTIRDIAGIASIFKGNPPV